jgi:hypothetical protein
VLTKTKPPRTCVLTSLWRVLATSGSEVFGCVKGHSRVVITVVIVVVVGTASVLSLCSLHLINKAKTKRRDEMIDWGHLKNRRVLLSAIIRCPAPTTFLLWQHTYTAIGICSSAV